MDIFAYVSLGLFSLLILAYVTLWLVTMARSGWGKMALLIIGFYALVICAIISAAWLVFTKLL